MTPSSQTTPQPARAVAMHLPTHSGARSPDVRAHTQSSAGPWKWGNEFAPYHPSASHVPADYRDGWNQCYAQAAVQLNQADAVDRLSDAELCDLRGPLLRRNAMRWRAERDALQARCARLETELAKWQTPQPAVPHQG